ncbi:MAG: hypothetical protein EBQ61_00880 [Micrococcales bacterium]|nr:hypothetical protein [Micrococcales bacterium]
MKNSKAKLEGLRAVGYFLLAVSLFLLIAMIVLNVFIGFTNFMQGFDSGNRGNAVSPIPASAAYFAIPVFIVSSVMVILSTVSLDRIRYQERFKERLQNVEVARLVKSAVALKALGLASLMAVVLTAAVPLLLDIYIAKSGLSPILIFLLLGISGFAFFTLGTTRKQLLALEQEPKRKQNN